MSDLATDTVAKPSLTDAYIPEESKVLDPSVLDKTLIERMPNPSGWRLLARPYGLSRTRYPPGPGFPLAAPSVYIHIFTLE